MSYLLTSSQGLALTRSLFFSLFFCLLFTGIFAQTPSYSSQNLYNIGEPPTRINLNDAFIKVGDQMLVRLNDGQLLATDGTPAGTRLLEDQIDGGLVSRVIGEIEDQVYFGRGAQLYRIDKQTLAIENVTGKFPFLDNNRGFHQVGWKQSGNSFYGLALSRDSTFTTYTFNIVGYDPVADTSRSVVEGSFPYEHGLSLPLEIFDGMVYYSVLSAEGKWRVMRKVLSDESPVELVLDNDATSGFAGTFSTGEEILIFQNITESDGSPRRVYYQQRGSTELRLIGEFPSYTRQILRLGERLILQGSFLESLYAFDPSTDQFEEILRKGPTPISYPDAQLFAISENEMGVFWPDENGANLYVTDGTVEGTRRVRHLSDNPWFTSKSVSADANTVLSLMREGSDHQLLAYDRASGRVVQLDYVLDPLHTEKLGYINGHHLFFAHDPQAGYQLRSLEAGGGASVSGVAFEDANGNGVQDSGEPVLPNVRINLEGGNLASIFTDVQGQYSLNIRPDNAYTLRPQALKCYRLTTAEERLFSVPVDAVTEINVGMQRDPDETEGSLHLDLMASTQRCGFEGRSWITVTNDGCADLQTTTVTLRLPEAVDYVSSNSPVVDLTDRTVSWVLADLPIGHQQQIHLTLQYPNEEFAGSVIELGADAGAITVEGAMEITASTIHTDTLRCAIDPNDKQVFPRRPEPSNSNYTQFDETLTYTVRFQNTGNDTAFTVRIEDQLSTGLDWGTFKPVTASHDYQASLSENGLATFLFEDILLPDSTTNYVESNGFVTFEIRTKTGLEDFTIIDNTAGIFFDFNEPVITNTVTSTLVEFLDEDMDSFFFWDECDDKNENAFPGAPEILGNGIDEDCNGWDETVSTLNPLPGKLEVFPNPTRNVLQLRYDQNTQLQGELISMRGRRMQSFVFQRTHQLELSNLPTGIYLLRLTDVRSGAMRVEKINIHR